MKKFNYTDWVIKNKYGKTLKENFTPDLEDDERKRKLIQQMIAKEKEARKKEITGMEDLNEEYSLWDKLKPEQRMVILDQLPFLQDPNKQEELASLSYDELMGKFPEKKERYMIDAAIEDEYAMGDVNEEPNEISYDDAKEKGLENPDKADISKDKDISDYELKRGMAIQKAIDQVKNEMKVTDKDGNDVTSDIIKDMEKSLEKAGYKITKGYSSDADIRPGYKNSTKSEGEEGDPEAIKGKHYPDEETVKKLKKGPYTPGGQNAHIDEEDLTFEPEDMDNPDEDLVIIGSGYLDIENKFGERPSMTNGEYAAKGQEVVDGNSELQKDGEMPIFKNKEAALDFIFDKINEVDDGKSGQQEPSEDDLENQSQDDIAMGVDDRHFESLQELAEALGYLKENILPISLQQLEKEITEIAGEKCSISETSSGKYTVKFSYVNSEFEGKKWKEILKHIDEHPNDYDIQTQRNYYEYGRELEERFVPYIIFK